MCVLCCACSENSIDKNFQCVVGLSKHSTHWYVCRGIVGLEETGVAVHASNPIASDHIPGLHH